MIIVTYIMQKTVIFKMRGECVLFITIHEKFIIYFITSVMKRMFPGLVEPGGVFWVPTSFFISGKCGLKWIIPFFLASVLGITSICLSLFVKPKNSSKISKLHLETSVFMEVVFSDFQEGAGLGG
ncbi:hypothetical protein HJG60_012243 [Phyllostomus discolor]|uniref:Uncharacterized protein n=1 Tax=Phyllostomus discolor TaxID=89673 RepID=A0A833Z6B9_9CHIR|nr:hypothetical protein HJG60_012243 [Phyllostomus discolor]